MRTSCSELQPISPQAWCCTASSAQGDPSTCDSASSTAAAAARAVSGAASGACRGGQAGVPCPRCSVDSSATLTPRSAATAARCCSSTGCGATSTQQSGALASSARAAAANCTGCRMWRAQ